jgi:hypothetical protein
VHAFEVFLRVSTLTRLPYCNPLQLLNSFIAFREILYPSCATVGHRPCAIVAFPAVIVAVWWERHISVLDEVR